MYLHREKIFKKYMLKNKTFPCYFNLKNASFFIVLFGFHFTYKNRGA